MEGDFSMRIKSVKYDKKEDEDTRWQGARGN